MTPLEKRILQGSTYRQLLVASLTLLASFLFISFGLLVKYAVDHPAFFASTTGIVTFCGYFLTIRLAMPLTYALIELFVHNYCVESEAALRTDGFAHISYLYAEDLEAGSKRELVAVFDSAMGSVGNYIRTVWSDSLPIIFQTLFIIGSVSIYLGSATAMAFSAVVVAYVIIVIKMTSARFPLMRNVALSQKKMTATLHELCSVHLAGKVYNTVGRSRHRYRASLERYTSAQRNIRNEFFRFGALTAVLSVTGSSIVLVTASSSFFAGEISLGSLIMLATFLFQVFLPLNRMGVLWRTLNKARIDFQLLDEALSSYSRHGPPTIAPPPPCTGLSIQLNDIGKRKGKHIIFSALNGEISFRPGLPTLLCGKNGIGKTSLARMICGVDKPESGTLYFNAIAVNENEYGCSRNGVTFCAPSFALLNDTVQHNITFFLETFNERTFHDLADKLGFDKCLTSVIGEQGRNLSAGEQQKLNIIISLLSEAKLLVLDEPTTHLDPNAAAAFKEIISACATTAHVLIITHDHDFINAFPGAEILNVGEHTISPSNTTTPQALRHG
ncbi:ABC transporter ATP-binding protein [Pseudomonas sp. SBB6]|uniref:ATP-binding cassette domain-containing protein n=1 Tax=Pseudomonas sp. SBB6 TaxID=2962032 RepID=UPI0020B887BD|nr:ABC transporter ATP-binding protein [Pseudomonas sp. SBB6]MCP3750485.1 ABC transporter ATP-binding protein/permease [Pseudomonas sp. SBB6]